MTEFVIEKASSNHENGGYLNALALDDMSRVFLGTSSEKETIEALHKLWTAKDNRFSHDKSFVAIVDGQHAGQVTCMDHKDMQKTMIETVKQVVKLKRFEIIRVIFRNLKDIVSIFSFKESESGEYHISLLATMPEFQGMGIASALIKQAETEARRHGFDKISLTVDQLNPNAIKLYKKKGFEVVEESTFGQSKLYRMVKRLR